MDRLWAKARDGYWRRAMARARDVDLISLKRLRADAKSAQRAIDAVLDVADARLAAPLTSGNRLQRPAMSDWAWRPALWRKPVAPTGYAMAQKLTVLDAETSLHHDCVASEISVRQRRNRGEADLAPYRLDIDVFRFDGGFLSLCVRLPDEVLVGMTPRHIIRLEAGIEEERPVRILARINLQSDPNIARVVHQMAGERLRNVEFDLGHCGLDDRRPDKAWIDLFFEQPQMNRITLHDLTVSRRPRAEL